MIKYFFNFQIVAITGEGKTKSKVAKIKTLKDECNKLL